jgi:hypothetical protein
MPPGPQDLMSDRMAVTRAARVALSIVSAAQRSERWAREQATDKRRTSYNGIEQLGDIGPR